MAQTLNHTPADVVRQVLIDLGLGSDLPANGLTTPLSDWPVYKGLEPSDPDDVITVYNTAGRPDVRDMFGKLYTSYGVQLRVRAADPDQGWLKADALRTGVSEVVRQQVNVGATAYFVQCFNRIGDVLELGRDAPTTNRQLYTLNPTVRIRLL